MARELPYAASVEAQYLAAVLEELEGLRADVRAALAQAPQLAPAPAPAPAPEVVTLREPSCAPVENTQETPPEVEAAFSSEPERATPPASKPTSRTRKR